MKLLVFTQVVDREDLVLGFFCRWIEELAIRFEHVHVICLKEGIHDFPQNVQVHSLGKEEGMGSLTYLYRFYTYLFRLRDEYDSVFVHMNQEYVLLGGIFWKLLGKPVYMWRNHYAGSWLTNVAALFCTKVFCTSKHSYTARFRRTVLMPVGIDYQHFSSVEGVVREPRSVLFLARISPSKRPEMLIDALGEVLARGISFTATIVGSPKEGDESYAKSLQTRAESLGLHDRVQFRPGVPVSETPRVFAAHDIFVNCSPSGMFDKTLFEASAAGCRVLTSSEDFKDAAGAGAYTPDTETLAVRIIETLAHDEDTAERKRLELGALARAESLQTLADRLRMELTGNGQ